MEHDSFIHSDFGRTPEKLYYFGNAEVPNIDTLTRMYLLHIKCFYYFRVIRQTVFHDADDDDDDENNNNNQQHSGMANGKRENGNALWAL